MEGMEMKHVELVELADLPPCPALDKYRQQAAFDWKMMRTFVEQPLDLKIKMNVWKKLASDPLFSKYSEASSTDEQKRITCHQLVRFASTGIYDNLDTMDYKQRTKFIMCVNEATAMVNPCLSVKIALGISLFANVILVGLGTERHLHFYRDVWDAKILSCLAITELAHGSDTKRMRTVAEYDPKTRQFVINTPDVGATKCWVGNLGKQCTHALLFAQLLAGDGTNHGLHLFVVPIRDPSTLLPFPGITVGDLGEKAGLHGIDNGFIMFHKYRIPRENLLNRTGDITPEGEYETSFSDPQRILGAALENLSCGRVAIMQESSNTLAKACVIAVRYAAQRTQFCDQQGIETPLIEYQLHQWRLFPYVAAAYALKFFIQQFTDQYLDCVVISKTDTAGFRDVQMMVSGVHAVVCCTKPLFTWICRNALQECREACGGHAFK
ncbi:LOW QUALITY PROTEIN: peroxisomal acyl-coenzyme A oxidase 3 [Nilaparvata lugens]|uniref:LOW QUALITY PROTEIN: peroxisomal acyl-coenzyme A oxidase 3 n=1 Tax=Nilaparvata lugens TaxID=108931 RepID=UPI00193CF41D|nr:LOW QUALITY PROTEIN: peroxisomal acyl-coenzyme A oxidase 3 [Nilaparvata lugens]